MKKINDEFLGASAFRKIAELYNIENPDEHPSFQIAMSIRDDIAKLDHEEKQNQNKYFLSEIDTYYNPKDKEYNHLVKAMSHNVLDEDEVILTISLILTYFSFAIDANDIKFAYFTHDDEHFKKTLETESENIFRRYYYYYFMDMIEKNNGLDDYYINRKKAFLNRYSAEFALALHYENNIVKTTEDTSYSLVVFRKEKQQDEPDYKSYEAAWAGMLIVKNGNEYFQDCNGVYLLEDFLENFPFQFSNKTIKDKPVEIHHIKDTYDLKVMFKEKFNNRLHEIAFKLISKEEPITIENIEKNIVDVNSIYNVHKKNDTVNTKKEMKF